MNAASEHTPRTVGDWLASRAPTPPDALAKRIRDALASHLEKPVEETAHVCLDAGERMLVQLLQSGSTSRDTAAELLAVDAMVTYAFEAAAETAYPEFDALAASAMQRIAAVPAHLHGHGA